MLYFFGQKLVQHTAVLQIKKGGQVGVTLQYSRLQVSL